MRDVCGRGVETCLCNSGKGVCYGGRGEGRIVGVRWVCVGGGDWMCGSVCEVCLWRSMYDGIILCMMVCARNVCIRDDLDCM